MNLLYREYDVANPSYRIDLMIYYHEEYGWHETQNYLNKMVANADLETVKFAVHKFKWSNYLRYYDINLLDSAIIGGQLETAQWLSQTLNLKPTSLGVNQTARNSHLKILKWIHKTFGLLPHLDDYPLPVVKWLLPDLPLRRTPHPKGAWQGPPREVRLVRWTL